MKPAWIPKYMRIVKLHQNQQEPKTSDVKGSAEPSRQWPTACHCGSKLLQWPWLSNNFFNKVVHKLSNRTLENRTRAYVRFWTGFQFFWPKPRSKFIQSRQDLQNFWKQPVPYSGQVLENLDRLKTVEIKEYNLILLNASKSPGLGQSQA